MSKIAEKDLKEIKKLMDTCKYEKARPLIVKLLEKNPNDPLMIRYHGNTYAYTGYLGKAKKIWRKGLKLFPENVDLLYNYALAHYLQGNLYYAKKFWSRARKYAPNDPEIYFNLGQVARDEGKLKKAIRLWKKSIEIKPKVEIMNNIGLAYATLRMFGKASVWYKKALEIDESYALAHYNLATTLLELGEFDEVITHADMAAELDPGTHMTASTNLIHKAKEEQASRTHH